MIGTKGKNQTKFLVATKGSYLSRFIPNRAFTILILFYNNITLSHNLIGSKFEYWVFLAKKEIQKFLHKFKILKLCEIVKILNLFRGTKHQKNSYKSGHTNLTKSNATFSMEYLRGRVRDDTNKNIQ